MNPALKQFLYSAGIAALVAFFIALGAVGFHFPKFWYIFGVAFVSQYVFFYVLSVVLEQMSVNRTAKEIAIKQAETIEKAISHQSVNLECAYCNTINLVPIILVEPNVFKCFNCKQDNSVLMQFQTARTTNPVARKVEVELAEHGLPLDTLKDTIQEREDQNQNKEKEKK